MNIKPRTQRSGTWAAFERRYKPLTRELNENFYTLGPDQDIRNLWTVVADGDGLYICPGHRVVDRFGFLLTTVPWDDQEELNTPYVY